ncbi:MAG: ROK family protein [Endozoicomonas sp.]
MRIGLDIGGTKTEIVVLCEQSEVIFRKRKPTPDNYQGWLENVRDLIQEAIQEKGQPESTGICLPGAISPDTGKLKNANTTYLNGKPVAEDLRQLLGFEVKLANDADCFALSEATDGAAADANSCFGIIIGTGCGGGLVFNGQLVTGPNAIAGEWGHNPLPGFSPEADGISQPCYCGRENCVETFLSGTGMAKRFRKISGLSEAEVPNAKAVMELKEEGDELASQHFDHYVDALARSIGSVINIFDPEVVVLGGGMSNVQALYEVLPEYVSRYVFSDYLNTRIVQAEYGDASGVRGAAWL